MRVDKNLDVHEDCRLNSLTACHCQARSRLFVSRKIASLQPVVRTRQVSVRNDAMGFVTARHEAVLSLVDKAPDGAKSCPVLEGRCLCQSCNDCAPEAFALSVTLYYKSY